MPDALPSVADSRKLYEIMQQIHVLAPWEWMEETNIFGVQSPDTQELGFVSIMGMAGEHYAVSVYLGARALYDLWRFEDEAPDIAPEKLLEIPQLMASFEDRSQLNKKDLDLIKSLTLKFRGKNAWPLFRSYKPGYFPWFVEAAEARFLADALEQVLDVAPRFKANRSLLDPNNDERYLVRVPRKSGKKFVWEDQVLPIAAPPPTTLTFTMDSQLLESLKQKPKAGFKVEIDCFMYLSPIQEERNARPVFPYMLLLVEAKSSMIIGQELLTADPTLETMWNTVPFHIMKHLSQLDALPDEIRVRSRLLFDALKPVAKAVKVKLGLTRSLPALEIVQTMLQDFMGGMFM